MRVSTVVTVALTAALSGSPAFGAAGTAAADAERTPAATPRIAAPGQAETTQAQFRVIEHLGRLGELTGTLGRLTHDRHANPMLLRAAGNQLREQLGRVKAAVEQARPARTLPATDRKNNKSARALSLADAARAFGVSVDGIVAVGRDDARARTAAAGALIRDLSAVNTAAMAEAGISVQPPPHPLPHPVPHPKPQTQPQAQPKPAGTTKAVVTTLRPALDAEDPDTRSTALRGTYQVIDEVGDLIDDILETPGGQLSRREAAEHRTDFREALALLRDRTATTARGSQSASAVSKLRARSMADVQNRFAALLKASVDDNARLTGVQAGRLVNSTVTFLAAMTDSSPTAQRTTATTADSRR
ncbi:MAG: hypothetical protein ACRDP3_06070 [Streptomyces sp.]|uniref:hypothetical protein n=1 Tax=Streptomyces sp. TaxID=1931 RepID=UPI003D6C229A